MRSGGVRGLPHEVATAVGGRHDNIAAFIDENLSQARFRDYLADPDRAVLAARDEGRIVGYVMLIRGVPDDVAEAVCFYATCSPYITGQILYVDGGASAL